RHTRSKRDWSSDVCSSDLDLHERAHAALEPGLASNLERLLVALASLLRRDALLQPIVPGDEELLNPLASFGAIHRRSVALTSSRSEERRVGKEVACARSEW